MPTATTVFRGWLWQWPQVSFSTPIRHCKTSNYLSKGRVAPHPAGGVCQARPKRRRRGGGGGWGREEEEQGCEQEGCRGIGGALRAGERPAGAAPRGAGVGAVGYGRSSRPSCRLRRFVLTPHVQQALRAVAGAVCVFFLNHYPPTGRPDSHF